MFSSALKSIGFGLAATGIQDNFLEESPGIYNWIAVSIGSLMYCAGTYLECREYLGSVAPQPTSTKLIKQGLYHAAGFGFVNGVTHFVKSVDTNSANFANLTVPMLLPVVLNELNAAHVQQLPKLKHGNTRFLILLTSDYFSGAGFKNIFNGASWSLIEKIGFPIGFVVGVAEFVYGRKNDTGLGLLNAINRRGIKIAAAMNFIFTL